MGGRERQTENGQEGKSVREVGTDDREQMKEGGQERAPENERKEREERKREGEKHGA